MFKQSEMQAATSFVISLQRLYLYDIVLKNGLDN